MRAYLYPGNTDFSKIREFFPDFGPGEMPVAGKPLCRHLVDLCGTLKVSEVFVADRFLNPKLAESLGNGAYWSFRLHYLNSEPLHSLDQLMQVREKFPAEGEKEKKDVAAAPVAGEEDALLFWGLFLPDIRNEEELFLRLEEITDRDRTEPETGVYLYRGGKYFRCRVPLLKCDTLKNYFDINFRLLQNAGVYSLPSYSLQHNYGIGRNVAILPRSEVKTPVLILNDVLISRGVSVTDGAIIGQFVFIDENTSIRHSIVLNNTYLGRNMVIRDKIVTGRRVLDPQSESYVDLDDSFLADDFTMQGTRHLLFMYMERLFALFLAIVELPVYLLVLIFWKFIRNIPFPKFFRSVYPRFWLAAVGKLQLVRFGNDDNYVFRYSDLWWPLEKSEYEKNMGDVFYYHHRNLARMAAVPLGSQIRRMLTMHEPVDDPA